MGSDAGQFEQAVRKAERRQLTVMFCDLVGSTELSTQYDPEDMRALLTTYREACASAIETFGGFIAQYLGDGILVYFGYPHAREHDAEYSVRAAQEVVNKLAEHTDPPLRVRIGIATGTVVVGDVVGDGTQERDVAIGQTPNLAARLTSIAEPDGIVISNNTQRLLAGVFEYKELGDKVLKGFAEPVRAWQVVGEPKVKSASHAIHRRRHLTPILAREEEISCLNRCWAEAKDGRGQVVLVSGEPGIGKSRLVRHFESLLDESGETYSITKLYCAEISQNSILRPFVNNLLRGAQVSFNDRETKRINKIRRHIGDSALISHEEISLALEFLSVEGTDRPERPENADISPETRKARTLQILEKHLCDYAREKPSLIVVEDLHWSDMITLELFERIVVDRVHELPMLILMTARPGFAQPWPREHYVTDIQVKRFSPKDAVQFLEKLPGAAQLPEDIKTEIIERSDRIPLFLEEVCKAATENFAISKEQGTIDFDLSSGSIGVPSSLVSSLMERLDRLGSVKSIAQLASMLGQTFSGELLEDVGFLEPRELSKALDQLVAADIIYPLTTGPEASYVFKHVLLQDAAYSSLLRSERKELHARIARVLEKKHPELTHRAPELIAHHWSRGGVADKAIGYWQKAGEHARRRSANLVAIHHLSKGLELLATLPANDAGKEREIDLRTNLALAWTALRGGGAREVKENYSRARTLSETNVNTPESFTIMIGSWLNSFIGGDLHSADALSREILAFASQNDDPSFSIEAKRARGMTLFYIGDFTGARALIEDAQHLHDPDRHKLHAMRFGLDPLVCCQSYSAYAHLFLGYPEVALRKCDEAIAASEALQHPYTLAFALAFAAFVRQNLEMSEAARDLATRAIEVAEDNEFQFWAKQQLVVQRWADARRDRSLTPAMHRAVASFLESGSTIASTRIMSLMAEAFIDNGQATEAHAMLRRAIDTAATSGESFYLAEIHRLKAELGLKFGGERAIDEICAALNRSFDLADHQNAMMWQRRTAKSVIFMLEKLESRNNALKLSTSQRNKLREKIHQQGLVEKSRKLVNL